MAFKGDKVGEIKVNIQSWHNELQGCGDDVCHFRIFYKKPSEKVRFFPRLQHVQCKYTKGGGWQISLSGQGDGAKGTGTHVIHVI